MAIAKAKVDVPPSPGLYAVHGEVAVWQELGLGEPTDARPLYVGKAERSLAARDVDTHLSTGKTAHPSVRRSADIGSSRDTAGIRTSPVASVHTGTIALLASVMALPRRLSALMSFRSATAGRA
jgi:hypothetical protein